MDATPPARLPRGRHGLSREEVARSQRERLLSALADAMADEGYVATSVGDVLKRAGVSRETFYQQFDSKQDCFLQALDVAEGLLESLLAEGIEHPGDLEARIRAAVGAYLEALAAYPAFARLVLVEVYAAGPEAMARRVAAQRRIARELAEVLHVDQASGRFGLELFVAGIGSLVTMPLVEGDTEALLALREPLVELALRFMTGTGG